MGFLTGLWNLVSGPLTTWVQGWQARKTAQLQSDLKINEAVTEAKINRLKTQQQADIAWENLALSKSGWKSGYLTIIFTMPLILMFIPPMVPIITAGFDAINHAPLWYREAVGVVVAADFGVRKFIDFMRTKKGA